MIKTDRNIKSFFLLNFIILLVLVLSTTACTNDNTEEFRAEGLKLMEEGNPNGAIVFFKSALEQDSTNFELRYDLVKAYIQADKRVQAEAEIKKCLVQEPTNIDLLFTAANYYTGIRDAEQALSYLAQIEELQKPNTESRQLVASNLRSIGKLNEAEAAYKEALEMSDNSAVAAINLSSLYLSQKRNQDALTLLNTVLSKDPNNINALQLRALALDDMKNYTEAESTYEKLIGLLPNEINPSYSLAELFIKQGKMEKAEEIYAKINKSFKSDNLEYLLAGLIAYEKGEFEEASKFFQQSVQASPSVNALYYLASSLHRTNNSELALSNLRRILDVQPDNAAAQLLTAQILHDQKRHQEAEYELNRLLKKQPENARAHNLLGAVLYALGRSDDALNSYHNALKYDATMAEATMMRSNILMQQNLEDDALAELEKGIKANTESTAVRTALFNFHMGKKNYTKAEEIVNEGLKEQPNNLLLLTMKAGLYMALKDNDKAVETLEKVTSIDPAFTPATELLLNVYMLYDNNEAALKLCDAYLEKDPENSSFIVTSSIFLDNLGKKEEATARLEKANALNSERALISLVRRALNDKDTAKAEKYLTDKLKSTPIPQVRSLLANYYVEQDSLQQALDIYNTEALKTSPEGLIGKFRLYMSAKMFDKALSEAEAIMVSFPKSPDSYVLKAFALENKDDFETAFKTLEEAYKELQDPQLLLQLANLCLRAEQYDKALSYFRTALLKDPNDKNALSGQANTFLRQKKYSEAIEIYEKILKNHPQDDAIRNNLALALAEEGVNTSRAVELATEVYLDIPENVNVIDTFTLALLSNKQIREAYNVIKNGLDANPDSAQLSYRHGLVLLADNKIKEGLKALERAIELGDFSELENAKKLINDNK